MRVLFLCPSADGFRGVSGSDYITTRATSGMPRIRRVQSGATGSAVAAFQVEAHHYDYLMAFWRLTKAEGFACRAILSNSTMNWYECRWVGAPTVVYRGAGAYHFSCEITLGKQLRLFAPKLASRLYPFEYIERLRVAVEAIDVVLNEAIRFADSYTTRVNAMDVSLSSVLNYINVVNSYQTTTEAMPVTLSLIVRHTTANDAYGTTATAMSVILDENVYTSAAADGYVVESTAIDVTLSLDAYRQNPVDIYEATTEALDVLLTDYSVKHTPTDLDILSVDVTAQNVTLTNTLL